MTPQLEILKILKGTYPKAKIVLNYKNNWELLVAVILSAQCTDKKVNEVTAKLFPKYQTMQLSSRATKWRGDLAATRLPRRPAAAGLLAMTKGEERQELINFALVALEELEQDIKPTGFYRNKAKNIQAAAKLILKKFDGKLPKTMEEMLIIPGVARKTANVVLGNAYGIVEGIAVDTHVLRLSQRLRLVSLDKIGGGKKLLYFNKVTSVIPAILRQAQDGEHRRTKAGIYTNNLNRFRIKSGMTVDYYKDAVPEKIEQELMKIIPKRDWFNLTYWLIDHGRAICKAQSPDCLRCPLQKLCPVSRI